MNVLYLSNWWLSGKLRLKKNTFIRLICRVIILHVDINLKVLFFIRWDCENKYVLEETILTATVELKRHTSCTGCSLYVRNRIQSCPQPHFLSAKWSGNGRVTSEVEVACSPSNKHRNKTNNIFHAQKKKQTSNVGDLCIVFFAPWTRNSFPDKKLNAIESFKSNL